VIGKVTEKLKKRKHLSVAFVIMLLFITHSRPVAAWGSDDGEGIIDKIINAIGDFFHAIVDGFKDFFNTILKAVEWPFTQIKYMFENVYNWSWDHLGPLGVIVFVAIAGATAYVAIFWFKQNIEQIRNW